jgi:hypothetical protein
MTRWAVGLAGLLVVAAFLALSGSAQAQERSLDSSRFYHYPYYYFPHNYWPSMGPQWPEHPRSPYMAPPGYMAYPPFLEPKWRYELWSSQRYYRGFHFWLDQF